MNKEHTIDIANIMKEHMIFQRANVGEREGAPESMFEWTGAKESLMTGIREEVEELLSELTVQKISRVDALEEMADVVIRVLDVSAHLCQGFAVSPEEFVGVVALKMQTAKQKYAPEHFQGKTAQEGMLHAKKQWKERQLRLAMNGLAR